ncbi:hypothetical protein JHK85_008928 [Glycine max]|nr:hypothetical protein JHK85_008928 [Glycine max]
MGYGRSRASSVLDGFSLNPVPYPVLLILSLILLFLGISWYLSYEEVVEAAEEQLGWMLLATPVVLILVVRWLSSVDTSEWFFFNSSPWERRRRTHHFPSEGSSPWGVAALILLVLVLLHYHSTFLDACLEVVEYEKMKKMKKTGNKKRNS